ncbi:MAG: ACT domain-containing protein [Candidatus Thorarchaeota archaeon]
MMKGSRDLKFLLKNMEPIHVIGEYVFTTISRETLEKLVTPPLLIYREDKAITVIIEKTVAEIHKLDFESVWGLISLSIHSDLAAVGFLAAVTNALAEAGISTNVVSAFYHDHLFVPIERVSDAISLLRELSKSTAG